MFRAIYFDPDWNEWMEMRNPIRVFQAQEKNEVVQILDQAEKSASEGCYLAGFVSYEAASAFDIALKHSLRNDQPLAFFAAFDSVEPVSLIEDDNPIELETKIDGESYIESIGSIKTHLEEGDVYQVNLTSQLNGQKIQEPRNIFSRLIRAQPTRYGVLIENEDFSICSVSPELFFSLEGKKIKMQPMKGTRPRGRFYEEDKKNKIDLQTSEKDRAENLMILDMVRNDLGRICVPGSLKASRLFELHRLPTVWQQTSSVSGITDASLSEIFAALFPCASVTGAPKVKAMEIISRLEETPRGVYTGAVGYLKPGGSALFNVAIRTMFIDKKKRRTSYGIGSGIVWDSDPDEELAESLSKAAILNFSNPSFELFETMKFVPGEKIYLLEEHIARIKSSAEYFDRTFDEAGVRNLLASIDSEELLRIRLLIKENGETRIETVPIKLEQDKVRLKLSLTPINSRNIFLFHKTTNRKIYELAKQNIKMCDDVILFNEKDEITETTISNIFLEIEGDLVTPSVECGLLPGTFRAHMLAQEKATERVLSRESLKIAEKIYVGNSVRGLQEAILVD